MPALTHTARMSRKSGRPRSICSWRRRAVPCSHASKAKMPRKRIAAAETMLPEMSMKIVTPIPMTRKAPLRLA